jgi:hypothetical protein
MKKPNKFISAFLVVAVVLGGSILAYSFIADNDAKIVTVKTTPATQSKTNESKPTSDLTTEELLEYLIEEEKLAHDVYTVMYQKYGANVFGNILESETTHQGMVLALLQARNIQDPRSTELGVFKNNELQQLYDKLITQGNISATEAYKVGVIIEEKDIADISNQLATTTDQGIVPTLESLRSGSENHLRAFNRQL